MCDQNGYVKDSVETYNGTVRLLDRTPIDPKLGFVIRPPHGYDITFDSEREARESKHWPRDERQALTVTKPKEVPVSYLLLGDFVAIFEGPYNWGTVTEISETEVSITLPYLHVSGCAFAGKNGANVIAYTGLETVTLDRSSNRPVMWLPRTQVPE